MTLTLELTPELGKQLQAQASAQGKPVDEYLQIVLQTLVTQKNQNRHAKN